MIGSVGFDAFTGEAVGLFVVGAGDGGLVGGKVGFGVGDLVGYSK